MSEDITLSLEQSMALEEKYAYGGVRLLRMSNDPEQVRISKTRGAILKIVVDAKNEVNVDEIRVRFSPYIHGVWMQLDLGIINLSDDYLSRFSEDQLREKLSRVLGIYQEWCALKERFLKRQILIWEHKLEPEHIYLLEAIAQVKEDMGVEGVLKVDFERYSSFAGINYESRHSPMGMVLADDCANLNRGVLLALVAHEFGHFKHEALPKTILFIKRLSVNLRVFIEKVLDNGIADIGILNRYGTERDFHSGSYESFNLFERIVAKACHQDEYWADDEAVAYAGKEGAERLMRTIKSSNTPYIETNDSGTHPSLDKRIQRIRRHADSTIFESKIEALEVFSPKNAQVRIQR